VASHQAADLLIFPHNGNGLEALDCLGPAWRLAGFVDDAPAKQGRNPKGGSGVWPPGLTGPVRKC
jgi:hypothetical protein